MGISTVKCSLPSSCDAVSIRRAGEIMATQAITVKSRMTFCLPDNDKNQRYVVTINDSSPARERGIGPRSGPTPGVPYSRGAFFWLLCSIFSFCLIFWTFLSCSPGPIVPHVIILYGLGLPNISVAGLPENPRTMFFMCP